MKTGASLGGAAVCVAIGAGVAFAGSYGGEAAGSVKVFALCVVVAFVVNWLVYIPSYINQTEHFFDLTGSLTYLTVTAISLLLVETRDLRTFVLAVLVAIWAGRLGTFLFRRVRAAGKDRRFDVMKTRWANFLFTWTTQGLWVVFTSAAAIAAITSGSKKSFGVFGIIGLLTWIAGFSIEVVADRQKSAFRQDSSNADNFIQTGLWAWSRHPNYFGEILLWAGVAIIAFPALAGWQYITLASPLFVFVLLTRVSGVPMLERRASKKWGENPEYRAYKEATPVLFPRPPSKASVSGSAAGSGTSNDEHAIGEEAG